MLDYWIFKKYISLLRTTIPCQFNASSSVIFTILIESFNHQHSLVIELFSEAVSLLGFLIGI